MDEHVPEEGPEVELEPEGGAPPPGAAAARRRIDADYLLDKVIPDQIDWRGMVRRHPLVSVSVAAVAGFLIGRSRGAAILAGASAAVTTTVMKQMADVFEGEVFEF